ncbi:thiamine-phosphate kinase [Modicisalibacter tunisiensis]|uniref:Thiamine-monophosphate kinase n=1 Tax=Modicisalibacter tunisiensis TaxID=390637 RepID=A0ABS7X0D1_9GAMM|nr:thiamine-phosphate kinase [Modicisalibacter tunisiensis]MBZ9567849.1 thiamine-phosphate kinase [Modicisalibacter tunisiensis]
MPSEFELIARFFARPCDAEPGVVAGPGDDCALLAPSAGSELAVSVDTSVVDVHFPPAAPAVAIGHRALAVALSDLAAMGARARWCLLAATLPEADEAWLESFAAGFHALCRRSGVVLVGGDVTRGPLSLSVTVQGEVPAGRALRRSGARAGDVLAVTGALGGGRGGLSAWQAGVRDLDDPLLRAYLLPEPRLAAGEVLRELAHAAIDVSDGLLADLRHLCSASGVGASLQPEALPLAEGLVARLGETAAREAALAGGDDYELLVALPPETVAEAERRLGALGLPLTPIGRVVAEPGIHGIGDGARAAGWQHFPGGAS